jgi:hypothetical protein
MGETGKTSSLPLEMGETGKTSSLPLEMGETEKSSSLPFTRGGLGWGNLTCVYTVPNELKLNVL